jgi:hypothetical protein
MCYKLSISHSCLVGPAFSLIQVNITTDGFPETAFRYYKFSGGYRKGFSIGVDSNFCILYFDNLYLAATISV